MADISLTASMRSNLLSLQNTTKLMDKTQERLSTGKKVNSALDNPGSYYSARSLENRAGDLNSLLDSMGQGISTVKAANEGIESITSFVEQAKAVANSAREQAAGSVSSVGTFQATPTETKTYTFQLGSTNYEVTSAKKGAALATDIENKLKAATNATPAGYGLTNAKAEYDNTTGLITITEDTTAADPKVTTTVEGYSFKLEVEGKSSPIYLDTSSTTSITDLDTMATAVNTALTGLTDDDGNTITGLSARVDNGTIVIDSADAIEVKITGSDRGLSLTGTAGSASRKSFMKQYNDLLGQITDLAKDSGYKGINLLQKDTLTVVFNESGDSRLIIEGDAADAQGLGLIAATTWGSNSDIDTSLDQINKAISSLRTMASKFGNNYSILQTREDFTEKLVNVLEEGADKLTLADMNEESANMLALQTRQQLAVNSLSLASQAAQSILKLFS